jgi:hypothetical protein
MFKTRLTIAITASGLTIAAAAFAGPTGRVDGFGPNIGDDRMLNENLGVLSQQIAWLNSPESDAYQLAQAKTENADFAEVAQMSTGAQAQGYFPSVSGDATLDRSIGVMSRLIAWQNSPEGDAFMVARAEPSVTGADFQRVALASLR